MGTERTRQVVATYVTDLEHGELVTAIWAGDRDLVARLVELGGDVNHRDPASGLTPLMIASGRGDARMTRLLLDSGADVLTGDSGAGATALHKACQGGSLDVVRLLVAAGAFVDAVAPTTGHTPLMDALWFKFPDIARFLLDQGAGLNLSTHYGFSLQEHFAYELNVNTIGKDRLLLAEQYLKERLAADDEKRQNQRLMAAVTEGDVATVRRLLAEGVQVDERFPRVNGFNDAHTPLLVAARDGHTEIAALLLEAGADVNATEPTFGAVPLHKAVYNGHRELTELIAGWPGVNLNFQGATNGYTPLHDALWHGYEDCARTLVRVGAALDLVGHDGKGPLDLAVEVFGPQHPLTQEIRARRG
jgi:ankyrin repeat protein